MILKKDKILTEVKSNFQVKQVQMGIDTKNIHKLLDMLSNIYTNPVSFIREWVSNAWDAHIKADKREVPVIFRMLDTKVEVEDFGTGMGPDIVNNIVANFAASTKDNDPNQIGAYGIGINSGFAWKDGFELQDFYNGTKYHYLFTKDTAGYQIILLYEEETERDNGCIFSIEMEGYEQDRYKPEIEKLIYFDNVVFEGRGADYYNNHKVFRYSKFVVSSLPTSEMFILLNQVKYKLDWDQMNLNRILFPIGVIIPQNESVIPTPTREGIYYTPEAVKLIEDNIKEVIEDLKSRYNKQISTPLPIEEYLNKEYGKLYLNDFVTLDVKLLIPGLEDFKLKGLEWYNRLGKSNYHLDLFYPFDIKYSLSGNKATSTYSSFHRMFLRDDALIFLSKKKRLVSNKNSFIRSKGKTAYLAYFRTLKLGVKKNGNSYYEILHLNKFPKSEWREKIIQYQKFIDHIAVTYCYDYDNLKVPKVKNVITSELVGRRLTSENTSVREYNFIKTLKYYKVIYSSDRDLLNQWYCVYNQKHTVLMHVSKKNEKMLDESGLSNMINIKEEDRLLKVYMRGVARLLANKLFSNYSLIRDTPELIKHLNLEVWNDISYIKSLIGSCPDTKDKEFIDSLLVEAIAYSKVDHKMMEVINRLRRVADNYEQMKHINWGRYWNYDAKKEILTVAEKVLRYDQLKERKRLLPYKNYK